MQHEPTSRAAEEEKRVEWAILELLSDETSPWSEQEIATELSNVDDGDVTDGIARLHRAGVVHRNDGFVSLTRAARHTYELLASL